MYCCSIIKHLKSDNLISPKITKVNSADIYHDGYMGQGTGAMAPFQFPTVFVQGAKTD